MWIKKGGTQNWERNIRIIGKGRGIDKKRNKINSTEKDKRIKTKKYKKKRKGKRRENKKE